MATPVTQVLRQVIVNVHKIQLWRLLESGQHLIVSACEDDT